MSTQDWESGWSAGTTDWQSGTTGWSTGWGSTRTTSGSGSSSSGSYQARGRPGGATGAGIRADRISLEKVVRFAESPRILALRARRKAREEDRSDDSLIRWGRPSEYGTETQTPEESRNVISTPNSNPKKDPQQNKREKVWEEVERETETVRVRNPSDSTQYVDVARIKSILFRGPDGFDHRFNLKPPKGEVV
jgi:hypothetical protein